MFNTIPTFDDYLEALRHEKLELAHEQARKERKRKRTLTIFDDDWGTEINADLSSLRNNEGLNKFISEGKIEPLKPQYPKEKESLGCNLWGSSDNSEEPKPKSNQERLKEEFGDRAE